MARKSDAGALPLWNLRDLYRNLRDPAIAKDVQKSRRQAKAFQKKYRGKVKKQLTTAQKLHDALAGYETVQQNMARPVIYANLEFACNQNDAATGAFMQEMRQQLTETNQLLVFFELELLTISSSVLARLQKSAILQPYRNFLQKVIDSGSHVLTEREEQIFSDLSLTGRSAFVRLYSEERAAKRYTAKVAGKKKELLESEILNLLYHPSRSQRREAASAFTDGLKSESRRLAYVFNTLLEEKRVRDRYRQYKNPEDSRHRANQISRRVVDTMTSAVVDAYSTVQEFYRFKAKVLDIKKLAYYDRLAPVTKSNQTFSFAEARTLILDAFDQFSSQYAGIAEEFFDRGWIDAAPRPGKRAGAFCSFVTPDVHPYVLMNYKGTVRDVFTLAHELGHGIHARLMGGTGYLNFDMPLTVAETASIFSEMLLFEHLVTVFPAPRDRFALYVSSVENKFGSVFRQISMHQFEQAYHAARRKQGEQSVASINQLWANTQRALYGDTIDFESEYEYWWMYIPHFIHTPFYVYAYAFGELLSIALFQQYKKKGDTFVNAYLEVLAAGGGASPEELFKPLGVRLGSRAFWQGGVDYITQQVEDTRALYSELG